MRVSADGVILDERDSPLAADLRKGADGFDLALSKIVATLLGLQTDEVFRRAQRVRRRWQLIWAAIAVVVVLLLIGGSAAYWLSWQRGVAIASAEEVVAQYAGSEYGEANGPSTGDGLAQAIRAIAEGAVTDPRLAKALAMIKAHKPAEAEPLLKAVAEEKAKRASREAKDAAAAYRNLGWIASVSDHKRAREYFVEAARLDDTNLEGLYYAGWSQAEAGDLDAAQKAYTRIIELAKPGEDAGWVSAAQMGLGDIQADRGNLDAALAVYQEAERVLVPLAKSNPNLRGYQMDLASVYEAIGNLMKSEQRDAGAFKFYTDSLNIRKQLTRTNPSDLSARFFLARSYETIGSMRFAQGNVTGAEEFYLNSQGLRQALVIAVPDNAEFQRALAISDEDIGDVGRERGDFAAAMDSYSKAVAISEGLARSDAKNLEWQRDLAIVYEHISTMVADGGMKAEALMLLQRAHQVIERAVQMSPSNSRMKDDLKRLDQKLSELSQ
jgi:tetratricopeptide (TPR) repeat protein